jgi:hypothetical protein
MTNNQSQIANNQFFALPLTLDAKLRGLRGANGSGTQNSSPGGHMRQSSAESAEQQSPG